MADTVNDDPLDRLVRAVEELAEDNVVVIDAANRIREGQMSLQADLLRELGRLRDEFAGALAFRTLKDVCNGLIPSLNAMEAMLDGADFADTETIRGHVSGLAITLRSTLGRMGVEQIPISLGEEVLDPSRHLCVSLVAPGDSPFPSAPHRTIVRIVEEGYMLAGQVLLPSRVDVQAERGIGDGSTRT
jgi:molecular chaperone GrpE (heat shock protein)